VQQSHSGALSQADQPRLIDGISYSPSQVAAEKAAPDVALSESSDPQIRSFSMGTGEHHIDAMRLGQS
jgi:hypothetical protein